VKCFLRRNAKLLKQEAGTLAHDGGRRGIEMTLIVLVSLVSASLLAADVVLKIRTLAGR